MRVAVVPHTHWDREWYLTFETYRARLVTMLDELIPQLAAGGPTFLLDGQMAVVDDYLEVRPEMEAQIRALVREGHLSVGPWYVLPDEFLVSGETLVRNLEMGLERGADFGGAMQVGYLPDMFGHIAQMPQILRSFGFTKAVVWRGVPAAIDRTGFWWTAPDGSTIRAEYLPSGYGNGARLPTDATLAADLIGDFEASFGGMLLGDLLWMHGGDHQAPTPDLTARIEAINAAQERYDLIATSLSAYLESAPEDDLPTWEGELRSGARANLLMGVASNRVDIRSAAGRVEFLIEKLAEPVAALLGGPSAWPGRELDRAWRQLVLNSAHDSVCGCSLDEVCDAVLGRYAVARRIAEGTLTAALARFAATLPTRDVTVVNPSPLPRRGLVEILVAEGEELPPCHQVLAEHGGTSTVDVPCSALPETVRRELDIFRNASAVLVDESPPTVEVTIHAEGDGGVAPGAALAGLRQLAADQPDRKARVLTLTRRSQLVLTTTPPVSGYGWAPLASAPPEVDPVEATEHALDNATIRVEIDPDTGCFSINGEGRLGRLVDGGDVGDTYNYCPPADDMPQAATLSDLRVVERGPLRGRVEIRSALGDLAITTGLELRSGEDFLRHSIRFANTARDHRLRVLHGLPEEAGESVAGCAFATVRRGLTAEGGPTERALPTYPARDFVTAGRLTVAAIGAFEYELVNGSELARELAVTVVRSTGWLSRGPMPSRPLPAGPEIPLDGSQVQQEIEAEFALAVDAPDPYALHQRAFSPLLTVVGGGAGTAPAEGDAIKTSGGVISSVRIAEGKLLVRAFNPSEAASEFEFGGVRTDLGPWQIRTLEVPIDELIQ